MAGPGKTGPQKKFLYGNKSAALAEALEKNLILRVGIQFSPEECRMLRDFMDLHEVAEPTQAIRLALQLGTAVASKTTVEQRLRSRIVVNEIRDWVQKKVAHALRGVVEELGMLSADAETELARLNEEYAKLTSTEEEPP